MLRSIPLRLFLALCLLFPAGCSSLLNFYDGASQGEAPEIYGGTTADILAIYGGLVIRKEGPASCGPIATAFIVYGIVDLPLSFAMDTILLPITVPWNLYELHQCKEGGSEDPSSVPPTPDDADTPARKEPPEPAESEKIPANPKDARTSDTPENGNPAE